jgi:hypothetical protein
MVKTKTEIKSASEQPSSEIKAPVWKKMAVVLVNNILKNALYVLEACKCKTLTEGHLRAISLIQSNIVSQGIAYIPKKKQEARVLTGGVPVLPSEYFGVNSGRYVDIAHLGPEVHLFSDTALARAPHPIKFAMTGGAALSKDTKIPLSALKAIVKAFQAENPLLSKISKDAMVMIHTSVQENVSDVLAAAKQKYGDKVTAVNLEKLVKEDPKYVHMYIPKPKTPKSS